MKVKNVSARLHWVGEVKCVPGEVAEIADMYATAINTEELVPVEDVKPDAPTEEVKKPRGRRASK